MGRRNKNTGSMRLQISPDISEFENSQGTLKILEESKEEEGSRSPGGNDDLR